MCSRPVGRMPLNTRLLWRGKPATTLPVAFAFSPLVTLAPKPSLQKSRFLASLEMTIFSYDFNVNQKRGRAEARPYNVLLTRCNLLFPSSEQFSRNDHPLHLAGPFINGDHARIPVHALDIGLTRVTDGAMRLHRLVHHAVHHLAGVKFGLGGTCAHFRWVRVLQPSG